MIKSLNADKLSLWGKKACFLPVFISFEGSNCKSYKLCSALLRVTKNETCLKGLSTHALHILLHLIHNKILLALSHLQIVKSCSFGLLKNNHGILEMFAFLLFSHSVVTLCYPMGCSTLSFPVLHCPLEFAQRHVHWLVMPSNYLILCHPILFLPSIFLRIRVFSNELALPIRWPKYWSFSFSISASNEYSGLISFRMDWLDLLAVQGTLKTFSNTTVRNHQFFGAQPSLWSNFHISRWLLEKP